MPFFDQNGLTATLQLFITIGILVVSGVAIVYSFIFLGGRVVTPQTIRSRLRASVIAAFVVIALAALDIYLAVTPS